MQKKRDRKEKCVENGFKRFTINNIANKTK